MKMSIGTINTDTVSGLKRKVCGDIKRGHHGGVEQDWALMMAPTRNLG